MKSQRAGSVASDAVTTLVSKDTYEAMNKTFSNEITGGARSKCMGICTKCGGKVVLAKSKASSKSKAKKASSSKKGWASKGGFTEMLGTSKEAFAYSDSLASNAADIFQKFNARLPTNVAMLANAAKSIKGGSSNAKKIAHLSELDESRKYKVSHSKVGGGETPLPKELSYTVNFHNINNKLPGHPAMTSEQNTMIANMDLASPSALVSGKEVNFGAIKTQQPFAFGQNAGKKYASKKKKTTSKKTKVPKKKTLKKK